MFLAKWNEKPTLFLRVEYNEETILFNGWVVPDYNNKLVYKGSCVINHELAKELTPAFAAKGVALFKDAPNDCFCVISDGQNQSILLDSSLWQRCLRVIQTVKGKQKLQAELETLGTFLASGGYKVLVNYYEQNRIRLGRPRIV